MWLCHDRLVSITTPRFLTSLFRLRFVCPIRRLLGMSAAIFFSCDHDPKVITWVLAVFIVRWFFTIQSSRVISSDWSIVTALYWSSSWYDARIWGSSTYITTLLLMWCGRSIKSIKLNRRPKWGWSESLRCSPEQITKSLALTIHSDL